MQLNPEQSAIVEDDERDLLVSACPGSGKTRVLVEKITRELEKGHRVVAITYTNKAAEEMRERILKKGLPTDNLWCGTIHSFCLTRILEPFAEYLPELLGVIPADETDILIVLDELRTTHMLLPSGRDPSFGIGLDGLPTTTKYVGAVEKAYALFLEMGKLHFDQILWYAYVLLKENPEVASAIATTVDFLAVDEYQDTQVLQFAVLSALLKGNSQLRVLIVGDPEQAIYLPPDKDVLPHRELEQVLGRTLVERGLTTNYRSEPHIVEYFRKFQIRKTPITPAKASTGRGLLTYNEVQVYSLSEFILSLVRYHQNRGVALEHICVMAPMWYMLDRLKSDIFTVDSSIVINRGAVHGEPGLKLDTTVGVKGAEYPVVIAFGLVRGAVPHWAEIIESGDGGRTKAMHKLYVLASRAEQSLHLIGDIGRRSGNTTSNPTKFLVETVGDLPRWTGR